MTEPTELATERLRKLVGTHGDAAWRDPDRSEGLLRDLLPGLERERHALWLGVKAGFPAHHVAARNPTEVIYAAIRAQSVLSTDYLVSSEDAKWIVDTWTDVLEHYEGAALAGDDTKLPSPVMNLGETEPELSKTPTSGRMFTPLPRPVAPKPFGIRQKWVVPVVLFLIGLFLLLRCARGVH